MLLATDSASGWFPDTHRSLAVWTRRRPATSTNVARSMTSVLDLVTSAPHDVRPGGGTPLPRALPPARRRASRRRRCTDPPPRHVRVDFAAGPAARLPRPCLRSFFHEPVVPPALGGAARCSSPGSGATRTRARDGLPDRRTRRLIWMCRSVLAAPRTPPGRSTHRDGEEVVS